jgi:plastocyanin
MDLWTQFLELLSQVITPLWGDLLQYTPLLLLGLIGLVVAILAWSWQRNAAVNRSRVPRPVLAGGAPGGVHLPSPSIWPFVVPIGLFLVFLSLIFAGEGQAIQPLLAGIGLLIAAAGAFGWFLDAGREYTRLEAHDQHLVLVPETEGREAIRTPPPGVHLPGPSAWPFLAPIGLFFAFAGLIFGPALIVGGLLMAIIAAVGWIGDAGREYRQTDAGHAPEPATHDPEAAFPKRLGPVYFGVGAAAIVLTLLPWLIGLLPGMPEPAPPGPEPTTTPMVSASSVLSFDQTLIVVVADQPITLTFDNRQAGVQHNVAIYDTPARGTTFFQGEIVQGPTKVVYQIPPLPAGEYTFLCDVHPATMIGRLISR